MRQTSFFIVMAFSSGDQAEEKLMGIAMRESRAFPPSLSCEGARHGFTLGAGFGAHAGAPSTVLCNAAISQPPRSFVRTRERRAQAG
jgi:hypothetical protein